MSLHEYDTFTTAIQENVVQKTTKKEDFHGKRIVGLLQSRMRLISNYQVAGAEARQRSPRRVEGGQECQAVDETL